MKRLLLFLATKKGYEVLRYLGNRYKDNLGIIVSFDEVGMQENWCEDIEKLSINYKIPFYRWKEVKDDIINIIQSNGITGAICISWRYLLPIYINDYLEDDLIVFHDSLLPKYRGFTPVVTAMLSGEKELGATAIFANSDVDTGEIICQKSFPISDNDYISEVIERMAAVYVEMVDFIITSMLNNSLKSVKQNEKEATYSIWRDDEDYRIDWSMPAGFISRLVHAVGYPYKGALTTDGAIVIRIQKCRVVDESMKFMIVDPGKIWSVKDNKPIVLCGNGLLCIEEALNEQGEKHIFKKLRVRLGG